MVLGSKGNYLLSVHVGIQGHTLSIKDWKMFVSHGKKTLNLALLSIESWSVNRDPWNGVL